MYIPKSLFITDTVDRLLHQAGVPRQFWHSLTSSTTFSKTKIWGKANFSAAAQRQVIDRYVSEAKMLRYSSTEASQNFFAVVSSRPTNEGAKQLCCAVVRQLLSAQAEIIAKGRTERSDKLRLDRIQVLYLNAYNWSYPHERENQEPDLVVVYGPTANSSAEYLERTRTLVDYYYQSVRLLAVAGVIDPERWCLSKLRLRPDVVFEVKDRDRADQIAEVKT